MNRAPRRADSLDRVEMLMAIQERHPECTKAFETLWALDKEADGTNAVPLHPYIAAPFMAKAIRNGFTTKVMVIACHGRGALGLDDGCGQFATGVLTDTRELHDVRHYPTLELASRAFLAESQRAMASNHALERTREG